MQQYRLFVPIEQGEDSFATFGVPRELSRDGGPEYAAKVFKQF